MVIAIASQKGGVGKTTTAISVAAGLARKGKRVLLIDIDSQANSSKVLIPDYPVVQKDDTIYATILERRPLPIQDTKVPNLSIAPSHILLSNTDIELVRRTVLFAVDGRSRSGVFSAAGGGGMGGAVSCGNRWL